METKVFIKEAHEHAKGKVCNKCNEHKLLSEFNKNYRAKDGHRYDCRSCQKEWNNSIYGPFKKWFSHQKNKSNKKQNGIKFTIEPGDIPGVKIRETITIDNRGWKHKSWEAIEYPKVCSKTGIELDWTPVPGQIVGPNWNSPSLDRIEPKFGYIPGNVRIVSMSYNASKGNCPPDKWDVLEKQIARAILFGNEI